MIVLGLFFRSRGGTLRQPLLVPDLLCFPPKSLQNLEVGVVRVEAVSDMSGQLTALHPVLVGQVGLLTSVSAAAGVVENTAMAEARTVDEHDLLITIITQL